MFRKRDEIDSTSRYHPPPRGGCRLGFGGRGRCQLGLGVLSHSLKLSYDSRQQLMSWTAVEGFQLRLLPAGRSRLLTRPRCILLFCILSRLSDHLHTLNRQYPQFISYYIRTTYQISSSGSTWPDVSPWELLCGSGSVAVATKARYLNQIVVVHIINIKPSFCTGLKSVIHESVNLKTVKCPEFFSTYFDHRLGTLC